MKNLVKQANVLMKCKLPILLLAALVGFRASATIPEFINQNPSYYQLYLTQPSGNPPPTIDATAFENQNIFSITYENYTTTPQLYQTWNTLNVTNDGGAYFIVNSPIYDIGGIALETSFGCGYEFDLHTTNQIPDAMAGTFDNEGFIRCDSIQDGNNLFSFGALGYIYDIVSLGQFKASATNLLSPGSIDVGAGGLIQLTGHNVDLHNSTLTVEGLLNTEGDSNIVGTLGSVTFSSTGAVGVDTNADWNPGLDLGITAAQSSFVPIQPYYVTLTNSQCYFRQDANGVSNYIDRYVFVENNSPNVTYNVYIDSPFTENLGFEPGAAHVEWIGNYTDPASGNPVNDYMYLTDDYALGASTNAVIVGGVPDNFTFVSSPTELDLGAPQPIYAGTLTFPDAFVTNWYSVMFGTVIPSDVSTNPSYLNPSGNITNLPAAVKISASNTLDLAYSTITGMNYMSLTCPNEFLGSPGAAIAAPYSDIALGVTNGFMTMSNVLMAHLPTFNGTINCWSTRFFYVDQNGNTNDARVLIVFSSLQPTSEPWIQHLSLHGTNQLVISDHLNVYGSLYSDASSVTLNTNVLGAGASSLDGELTWLNISPLNCNSGSGTQQFPNLLWLTNNGAIRALQSANFGNSAAPAYVLTPPTPAVAATGTLSEIGTNAVLNDKVTIGTNVYTFVKTLTTAANQVAWTTSFDGTMSNLIAAINGATGSGSKYSTTTKASKFVTAGKLTSHAFTVTAISTNAAVGNSIATGFTPATLAVNLSWGGNATLNSGSNYAAGVPVYTSFINNSLLSDQGTTLWTTYFQNYGVISNGLGSFIEHSSLTVISNSLITANGDVTLIATNPALGMNGITVSSNVIFAGNSMSLISSGTITDGGVTNGNVWSVDSASGGGAADSGFNTRINPYSGDLLGTTVTNTARVSRTIYNVWAGHDYGVCPRGYTNNLAVGHMVLDSFGPNGAVAFNFSGAGVSNALYIDLLELKDGATYGNATNNYNFSWLKINTNIVIYYAQALENGHSVAEAIDDATRNGGNYGRLRWVYSYAGYFSSTNYFITNADSSITTNTVNTALAQSQTIDSDSDGLVNAEDPTPFFLPQDINLTITATNNPANSLRIDWVTIPHATNYIYYATNMMSTNWLPFTGFKNWYFGNVTRTNSAHTNFFASPQIYISTPSVDNAQRTNVWVTDPITNVPHYYRVVVWPWLNFPE